MAQPDLKRSFYGERENVAYGFANIPSNLDEDRSFVELNHLAPEQLSGISSFGIFDGHGGAFAASKCSSDLHRNIVHTFAKNIDNEIETIPLDSNNIVDKCDFYLSDACKECAASMHKSLVKETRSGSTWVAAFVMPLPNYFTRIICPWIGDSRASLFRYNPNGSVDTVRMTQDHKPTLRREVDRIHRRVEPAWFELPVEVGLHSGQIPDETAFKAFEAKQVYI